MDVSFMYHGFGLRTVECSRTEYKDNGIVLNVQTRDDKLCCPVCKSKKIIRNGYSVRRFRCVPIGRKPVYIDMRVQRIKCRVCGCDQQESIPFTSGKRHTTHRLERLVVDLMKIMTISETAAYLGLSWSTVKDIHKNHLKHHYASPDIRKVRFIGIDEFAVLKGHVYKTIVVDLETGHIIYVGDGKGADALDAVLLNDEGGVGLGLVHGHEIGVVLRDGYTVFPGRVPTARILFAFLSQPLKRLAISVMPLQGCWLAISVMPLQGCWLRVFMLAKLEEIIKCITFLGTKVRKKVLNHQYIFDYFAYLRICFGSKDKHFGELTPSRQKKKQVSLFCARLFVSLQHNCRSL